MKGDTRSLDFSSCKVSAVRVHGFRLYMIWAERFVGSQFGTAYLQVKYWDLYLSSGDIVKQVHGVIDPLFGVALLFRGLEFRV